MRINQNIAALNAYRNMSQTDNRMDQSLERLSSGLRINRAADDAAGLAISEKMRGQVSGLEQASSNAQDAISLIQTGEGALNETHDMLQSMRELAVQSANDTLTQEDRNEIQAEVNELAEELTRIADTTEFNTKELLDGTMEEAIFHIGANEGQNVSLSIDDMSADTLGVSGAEGFEHELTVEAGANTGTDATDLAIGAGENTYDVVALDEEITVEEVDANYALTNEDGEYVAVSEDGTSYTILTEAVDDLDDATLAEDSGEDNGIDPIEFGDPVTSGTVTIDTDFADDAIEATGTAMIQIDEDADLDSGTYTVVDAGSHEAIGDTYEYGLVDSQGNVVAVTDQGDTSGDDQEWVMYEDTDQPAFTIAEGPENELVPGDEITISSEGGIDVSTQGAADSAIGIIDDAIETVSSQRSELGAMQNRMEHTIANLDVAAENLTAAESRIRDLDMASEMSEFTRNQIMMQAGSSMLAQANMKPEAVLQLLG